VTISTSTPRPVALVTGGAGGLGRVIASTLLADGFRVAIVDIDNQKLDDATSSLRSFAGDVFPVVADISREQDARQAVAATVSHWGRVDALVNNAGIEPGHTIGGVDMETWDRTFAVNLRAPMMLIKHCVPPWTEQGGGTVVCIGSRTWLSGSSTASYVASKAGLVGLVRAVASELGPLGVTANVVAPSFVRSPLNAEKGNSAYVEDYASRFIDATPLRRLIDPVDVANAVAFLASPRARNITGEVLNVAAGTQLAPAIR
jgi:3-oxoacyl-[acyl-carrier protein] reductase